MQRKLQIQEFTVNTQQGFLKFSPTQRPEYK